MKNPGADKCPLIQRLQSTTVLAIGLPVLLLLVYAGLAATGFGPYITDDHPFRQTQTALTARYFAGFRDFFYYQTPVLGPPWSVPFEFPIYQALAKALQATTGLTLQTSGRLVSMGFFLACFWPLYRLVQRLGVAYPPLVLGAVLLAPVHVFWSRAFMIETAALFFALAYFWMVIRWADCASPQPKLAASVGALGCLAILTKVTTFLPLALAAGAFVAFKLARAPTGGKAHSTRFLAMFLLVHACVIGLGALWISHTDALKLLHPLGRELTSAELRNWNFGALSQRVDPRIWFALANNTTDMFFPLPRTLAWLKASLLLALLLFVGWCVHLSSARRRWQLGVLLALFLLPFAIFTNLHRIHNYYQVANGVFLCLAIGLAWHGALESPRSIAVQRWLLMGIVATLTTFAGFSAWYLSYKSSHQARLLQLSEYVRTHSSDESLLVVAGLDWSAELAFQAERRALMIPRWAKPDAERDSIERMKVQPEGIAFYIACRVAPEVESRHLLLLGLSGQKHDAEVEGCRLYKVADPFIRGAI